jgi:hypothetical protein
LWAEDGVFVDHNSRYEGHSGIDHAVAVLIEKFPNFTFTERGELQAFNGVGKLDWGFGPAGERPIITGIDVLVMKRAKIGALYSAMPTRMRPSSSNSWWDLVFAIVKRNTLPGAIPTSTTALCA